VGILVFGELHGRAVSAYTQVIGGSLLMMLGIGAIAFSSASAGTNALERRPQRESQRYVFGRLCEAA